MPIILNNKKQKNLYTPKFFSDKLTGKGQKTGILNNQLNLFYSLDPTHRTSFINADAHLEKKKIKDGKQETRLLPFNVMPNELETIITLKYIENTNSVKFGENDNNNFYLSIIPHFMILQTESNIEPITNISYKYIIMAEQKSNPANKRIVTFNLSFNPLEEIEDRIKELENKKVTIDHKAYDEFIQDYSLHDELSKLSEIWQTKLDIFFEEILKDYKRIKNIYSEGIIQETIERLNFYKLGLEEYKKIHKLLEKYIPQPELNSITKNNINLLLLSTLTELQTNKNKLQQFKPDPNVTIDPMFSIEQQAAIKTEDPLVLVQSVAGSGKSTTLLARIKYITDCGVDPKDITVLSFTNAAANNIAEKNAGVCSLTIAKMIHDTYSENYPQHTISTIDTLINTIGIYCKESIFTQELKGFLYDLKNNKVERMAKATNFIEENFDKVIEVLDACKQTSLELEIIICYLKLESLKEPSQIKSKFLIIDEVQDNSIFEFIYTLKYVNKHKNSLFIVGDASQTLYEFRASNPKALNVIEMSDIFKTYKLQTNYRSKQTILDFANALLSNIECNQFANLRLRANSLEPITLKDFKKNVIVDTRQLNKQKEVDIDLPVTFKTSIKEYIDEKLKKGEKVCCLAHSRIVAFKMKEILESMYPNEEIYSYISNISKSQTIFSNFINKFWDSMKFVKPEDVLSQIPQQIYQKIGFLSRKNNAEALDEAQKLIKKWKESQKDTLDLWTAQLKAQKIKPTEYLDLIKENMLKYEIQTNSIRQSLISQQNELRKTENKDYKIAISTIHGVKGLEFDNTIVVYLDTSSTSLSEEKKRMYYVAFTRAKKSEYIINYTTKASSKLESDYDTIIKELEKQPTKKA